MGAAAMALGSVAMTTTAPAGASPAKTAVYYAGKPVGSQEWLVPTAPANVLQKKMSEWKGSPFCQTANAGLGVGTPSLMSGFSVGRVGPELFLARATPQQRGALDQIQWIDPGSYDDMQGSCDTNRLVLGPVTFAGTGAEELVRWLRENSDAKLVVLAGPRTADADTGGTHQGLQRVYFNLLRATQASTGVDLRSRVLVCNYATPGSTNPHATMFAAASKYIGTKLTTCPADLPGATLLAPQAGWHP